MKLFLDSYNPEHIKELLFIDMVQGISVTPSPEMSKQDYDLKLQEIIELCRSYKDGIPLNIKIFAEQPERILTQAIDMAKDLSYDKLILQIPFSFKNLHTISALSQMGTAVNVTGCVNAMQMQTVKSPKYVSFDWGQVEDTDIALNSITEVRRYYYHNQIECDIIVENVAEAENISKLWTSGAGIVSADYITIKESIYDDRTEESRAKFIKDYKNWMS